MCRKLGSSTQSMAVTVGAVALGFEAEPAVPGADVEHAFAVEVGGKGNAHSGGSGSRECCVLEAGPVGQFEAVIPAALGEFLAEVPSAAGGREGVIHHDCRLNLPRRSAPSVQVPTRGSEEHEKASFNCGTFDRAPLQHSGPGIAATHYLCSPGGALARGARTAYIRHKRHMKTVEARRHWSGRRRGHRRTGQEVAKALELER